MKWFRFYHDALDDPKVQRLSGDVYKTRLIAAVRGEVNEFTPYIGPGIEERLQYPEWKVLRASIFERDGYTCRYCGCKPERLECDHVVPLSRGGSNEPSNLVTACHPCNRSKSSKLLEEWRQWRG